MDPKTQKVYCNLHCSLSLKAQPSLKKKKKRGLRLEQSLPEEKKKMKESLSEIRTSFSSLSLSVFFVISSPLLLEITARLQVSSFHLFSFSFSLLILFVSSLFIFRRPDVLNMAEKRARRVLFVSGKPETRRCYHFNVILSYRNVCHFLHAVLFCDHLY